LRSTEGESESLSGQPLTISWTVSNRGSRETRRSSWVDGVYLSRDASLDYSDHALQTYAVQLRDNGQPKTLRPGESYTASITTTLPESISGDFHLLVNTDTAIFANPYSGGAQQHPRRPAAAGSLPATSGRNGSPNSLTKATTLQSTPLSISLATPPDLQLAEVTRSGDVVIAGQDFTVGYRVVNVGGDTPGDQGRWYDLIYLSRDRFLDIDAGPLSRLRRAFRWPRRRRQLRNANRVGQRAAADGRPVVRLRHQRPGTRLGRRRVRQGCASSAASRTTRWPPRSRC
jgi:hypothetical protein